MMPLDRKAVTLSFCQTSRSSRRITANLVSNMQVFSRKRAADHSAANAIAGAVENPLERSCMQKDRIVVAPELAGIERIEARFHGKGFEPHRHDTYALGVTMAGIQTFRY